MFKTKKNKISFIFRVECGSPLEKFALDYQQLVQACEQGHLYYINKDPVDPNYFTYDNDGGDSASVVLAEDDEGSDDELMGEYFRNTNGTTENGNEQDRPRLKLKINLGGSPKKNSDGKIDPSFFKTKKF